MTLVLSYSSPVARTSHKCWLCGRTVEPGERYHRAFLITEWGPDSVKMCAHCRAMEQLYGDEYIYDHHEGYWRDDVEDWDPETPAGCIAQARWRERWRAPTGALYPVPAAAS
jgi:predicted RNA-binding Zn-ribbon protein involved in translation (DUF1610 family)